MLIGKLRLCVCMCMYVYVCSCEFMHIFLYLGPCNATFFMYLGFQAFLAFQLFLEASTHCYFQYHKKRCVVVVANLSTVLISFKRESMAVDSEICSISTAPLLQSSTN